MSDNEDEINEPDISEDEFDINQELRELYYSPADGYSGVNDLYRKARERNIPVTQKQVRNFLKAQDTYTKHFPKGGPFVKKKFRPTIVGRLAQQMQMDLVIMTAMNPEANDGNKYILTSIEILSRYAFTEYQKTKNGKDTAASMKKIFEKFKEHFGHYPDVVQFDDGAEFLNKPVKKLLAELGIKYFSTLIRRTGYHLAAKKVNGVRPRVWGKYTLFQRKASIVERLNRTLRNMMWKYFNKENTEQWIHILDDITHNYNNSYHRSIKMKPNQVNEDNAHEVWLTLYAENTTTVPPEPKFKIGDKVRVEKYLRNADFIKGYTTNFSDDYFKIIGIYRGVPTMYKIQDLGTGEEINGRFYERELSLVKK